MKQISVKTDSTKYAEHLYGVVERDDMFRAKKNEKKKEGEFARGG